MRTTIASQTPTPPAAAAPAAPGASASQAPSAVAVDFAQLQLQASNLSYSLAGLTARHDALSEQLAKAPASARPGLQSQVDALDVQIAEQQAQLANVRSQIADRSQVTIDRVSETGQILVPPPHRSLIDRMDPDAITAMSILMILTVVLPLSIAVARRIIRGGKPAASAPKQLDELMPKMDRLEHAVDAMAIEIERISEGQRFLTRVIGQRGADAAAAAEPATRALGAGPAEPVRVAQREGVHVHTPTS